MSIEKLLEIARQELTDEQRDANQLRFEETLKRLDKEFIERYRCQHCGADTINYSHLFSCPRRGLC